MIKYIIFDFGKVLGYPKTGKWFITPKFMDLIRSKNIDINTVKDVISKNNNLVKEYLSIKNIKQEFNMFTNFYSTILNDLGLDNELAREIAYDKVYNNSEYSLYEDVRDILSKLNEKYTLIMLTNNFPSIINYLKYEGIYDLFDRVYVSSIYGISKNDDRLFDMIIHDYNMLEKETVLIDDFEDILDIGFKKHMNAIMLDRENKKESKYQKISNLRNLMYKNIDDINIFMDKDVI